MERFGEKISAEACSGKDIAGLLKKIVVIVCVLHLYACVVLVIHLCNHVITSDYISIPCGLVIALYCTYDRDIF